MVSLFPFKLIEFVVVLIGWRIFWKYIQSQSTWLILDQPQAIIRIRRKSNSSQEYCSPFYIPWSTIMPSYKINGAYYISKWLIQLEKMGKQIYSNRRIIWFIELLINFGLLDFVVNLKVFYTHTQCADPAAESYLTSQVLNLQWLNIPIQRNILAFKLYRKYIYWTKKRWEPT